MEHKKPLIAVPIGDPAGVGPEIVAKACALANVNEAADVIVIGDKQVMENAIGIVKAPLQINIVEKPAEGDYRPGILNLIDLDNIDQTKFSYGVVQAMCGEAAFAYIKKSIELAMSGEADAVATTPINKEALHAANVPFIGHTEIFGELTGTKESLAALKRLGVTEGKMAIAGLNPHCGEHGLFGWEEVNEITPAVEELQAEGYPVVGPIGADSVFHQAAIGRYNSVLSLYHDQGHIATKTLDFDRTISITNGMPILRTSVDHGTAFDIAGKGIVSEISMAEAILLAAKYAPFFARE